MYADEVVLPVIEIVGALAQIEVNNANGIDFFHLIIFIPQLNVLRNCLSHTVEDTLQIVELARLLNLNQYDFALRVLGLDVHAVEFVVLRLLVPFTLK